MLGKALEMGVCRDAPLLANTEGCSFIKLFERTGKFLYLGKFLQGN